MTDRKEMLPEIKYIYTALAQGNVEKAHKLAYTLKSTLQPCEGLDLARAKIFLVQKQPNDALQALLEELRLFPHNVKAQRLLEEVRGLLPRLASDDRELGNLLSVIEPYTMVSAARLHALYVHAREICRGSLAGNFVECGVAAGGTSGLLSAALHAHDAGKTRRLFSFDTFSGMPTPTEADMHNGVSAQSSGWGKGTCAAPLNSLAELLRTLGTEHLVTPVQGLFGDTLPVTRADIGPIALLHMDGDWYESTRDILVNLYDQITPGGYVQVDDYGHWEGCKKAMHDFFLDRGITPQLHKIDGSGVFFHKP